ncbi:MAG: hypothetical protein WC854_05785, partial [Bacteroidales bacterium]
HAKIRKSFSYNLQVIPEFVYFVRYSTTYKNGRNFRYLTGSQERTNFASNGLFSYGNDIKDLFHPEPHNVCLVKVSYWFSI